MSHAIRKMEQTLGVVLFERSGRNLSLSAEGEALMRQVFLCCRDRGAVHVDLKTNTVGNAAAFRLCERLGMIPVGWEG